jgi:Family of unknown function (DUF5947)
VTLQPSNSPNPLGTLRRWAQPRVVREQCELCSLELAAQHQHLFDPARRELLCTCDACAVLFSGQQGTRYRRVPRRVQVFQDFRMTDVQWAGLQVPINLAYFCWSTPAQAALAYFPSPAGPTEAVLPPEAWQDLLAENPVLRDLEPDVEALLVNRVGPAREYYRAPIDECCRLVGLVRTHWRGMTGGTEVWREIGRFFKGLQERASSCLT